MKKLMKIFLIMVIGLTVALATTQVFADDFEDQFAANTVDLTTNEPATTTTNTPANETVENTVVNNVTTNTTNNTTTTNKNSSYNNTNLPKTGIEDALPVAILVVVCGISAAYAYKKINDYKNI